MDVVVTGAGGFIGSHLVPALLNQGHCVTAVVGQSRGQLDPALASSHLHVVASNLADRPQLPERIDAIVHAAARSPAPGVTSADMVRDNYSGTQRLVEYALTARAKKFIYFSSLSVHGAITRPVVDEATPIAAAEPYGLTKYLGEMALRDTTIHSLSIRLPGVIGRNSARNWLSGVLEAAKAGRDIAIFNADKPFNNATHIDDLCSFVAGLLVRDWIGHDAVTVGADGMTTVGGAVELIRDAVRSKSKIVQLPPREAGFQVSSRRAIDRYGYRPMEITAMLRLFAENNSDVVKARDAI